jgi:HSP20 family protein
MNRTLLTLNPVAEFQRMIETMDRAFDAYWGGQAEQQAILPVPIDIYERDQTIHVCAAVPGVAPEDLDIQVADNVLTIRGETKQEWESSPEAKVYRREQRYGRFSRSIRLPEDVEVDQIEAEFNHGFVTIKIPRVVPQAQEPKRIQVKRADSIDAKPRQPELEQKAESHQKTNGKKRSEEQELSGVG